MSWRSASVRPEFSEALARAEGGRASRDDLLVLASAGPLELLDLMSVALSAKASSTGRIVMYSRNAFVPLTNLCMNRCSYCGFRRDPGQPGAGYVEVERAIGVARAAERMGAKELLVSSGDRPEAAHAEARAWLRDHGYASTLEYAVDLEERVLREAELLMPHTNIGLLSKGEMAQLKPLNASMGLMLESSSPRLMGPDPGMPHRGSPTKDPSARLRMIEEAGELGIPFTTGILMGIGETWEERIDSLLEIKRLNDVHGHVQEVIVQGFMPEPGTPMASTPPPEPSEVAKAVAMARLIMGGSAAVQVPPNLSGPARQLYLLAGADDWGGVSALTPDYVNPKYPWPSEGELEADVSSLGMELRERLAAHPKYVLGGWLPEALRARAAALISEDGLVRTSARQRL